MPRAHSRCSTIGGRSMLVRRRTWRCWSCGTATSSFSTTTKTPSPDVNDCSRVERCSPASGCRVRRTMRSRGEGGHMRLTGRVMMFVALFVLASALAGDGPGAAAAAQTAAEPLSKTCRVTRADDVELQKIEPFKVFDNLYYVG